MVALAAGASRVSRSARGHKQNLAPCLAPASHLQKIAATEIRQFPLLPQPLSPRAPPHIFASMTPLNLSHQQRDGDGHVERLLLGHRTRGRPQAVSAVDRHRRRHGGRGVRFGLRDADTSSAEGDDAGRWRRFLRSSGQLRGVKSAAFSARAAPASTPAAPASPRNAATAETPILARASPSPGRARASLRRRGRGGT